MNPCISCGRQPGEGDECRHCGQAVVSAAQGKPLSNGPALEAVAAARELLKNARKQGTIGGAGDAQTSRPLAQPYVRGPDVDDVTSDDEAAAF